MADKFFILWNPNSSSPPTRILASPEQARKVAEEMANKNPGEDFHVLTCEESVSARRKNPFSSYSALELQWVKRTETAATREAREKFIAEEKARLAAMAEANKPKFTPTIPNMVIDSVPQKPKAPAYTGRTGPMQDSESDAAKARGLIGKRVRLLDASKVHPDVMDTAFRNQIGLENRVGATRYTWGTQKPQTGDMGTVADAGTIECRDYNQFAMYLAMSPVTRMGTIALVVRLDRGINVVVELSGVEEPTEDPVPLPAKYNQLVDTKLYLLASGEVVKCLWKPGKLEGKPSFRVADNSPANNIYPARVSDMRTWNQGNDSSFYLVPVTK